jgi:phage terminase large subunit
MQKETSSTRVTNEVYKPIWNPPTRIILVTGGRGSGKSDAVSLCACDEITSFEDWVTLYTRWTLVSAEISIIPEFRDKIEILGKRDKVQISGNIVRSLETGSTIIFSGIKAGSGTQTARLKSLKGLNKVIFEEFEEFRDEKEFNTIDDSIRALGVPNIVVIVMNPQDMEHWVWGRWFEKSHRMIEIEGVQIPISTHPDITHIHTTYLDNVENLSPDYLSKIKKLKADNPEAYAHRYLGQWLTKKEGVIYPNWIEGEFDNSLPFGYGLDLGFFPDPLALVKVAVDTSKMKIYLHEEVYKTNLSDEASLAIMLDRVEPNALVVNDTSEPRLIDMLTRNGLNMQNAVKGKDSIKEGIRELSKFQFVVTPESYNLKNELRNYVWNDKKASIPIAAYDHGLDSVRYIATRLLEGSDFIAGNY